MASPKLTSEESLAIVEKQRQERLESTKNFLIGFAKAATTDLPGFLMDVADKMAGDTTYLGEKDRSAQLFEAMTGIKTKSGEGGIPEFLGSLISPSGAVGAFKAAILPAFAAGKSLGALKEADRLLDAGVSAQEVFTRTGIYQDPTGAGLRSVVSDQGSKLLRDQVEYKDLILKSKATGERQQVTAASIVPGTRFSLGDILEHPELEKLIPNTLRDVTVVGDPTGFGGGAFNPSLREISLKRARSPEALQSTLLHEVQHAIQEDFSMPRGGNTEMFFKDPATVEMAKAKLKSVLEDPDIMSSLPPNALSDLFSKRKSLNNILTESFNLYERIPGEAEARAVQSLFESGGALSSRVPTAYYDVPLSELIDNPQLIPKLDQRPDIQRILREINSLP